MNDYRGLFEAEVAAAIGRLAEQRGVDVGEVSLASETPPSSEMGDLAFPLFPLAGVFRSSPAQIAGELAGLMKSDLPGECVARGPYLNVRLDRPRVISDVVATAVAEKQAFGHSDRLSGRRVMIEFSSPNTNKPLHVGHLRNDALGESVSRILSACGAEVRKVNLINDRGIHICQSMLAYQKFGKGETPESAGVKGDHLVGDYYVKYSEWSAGEKGAEKQAQEMLRKWEEGDPEVVGLWRRMNDWVLEGIRETYSATGVAFDQIYFESETYSSGKAEVRRGLEKGLFYAEKDGSVWVDLEPAKMDKKLLLRGNGTSVYVTQDIGTVLARYQDWPFDQMIYVVASEQDYHFRVLFYVLGLLGHEWASQLHHLSYGMVNLPEGRMKSRAGMVADADDLIRELATMARQEIRAKGREEEVGDVEGTAHRIAIGAIHYYLLQVTPQRDMIFNPKESLSFTGNTGPYLQYMCVRISSMLRKAKERDVVLPDPNGVCYELLTVEEEWLLARQMARFGETIAQAAEEHNPSIVAGLLYEIAKTFSAYYHDHPILAAEDPAVRDARLLLTTAVLQVLKNGLTLLNIPFLEVM
jgi:arginyl-tRNA synthetase